MSSLLSQLGTHKLPVHSPSISRLCWSVLFQLFRHSSRGESHCPAMLLILKIHTQRPRLSLFLLPLTMQQRSHYFHPHNGAKEHACILFLGLKKRKKKKELSSHLQSLSKRLSCYHMSIIQLNFCFSDDQRNTTEKKMSVELYSTHQVRSAKQPILTVCQHFRHGSVQEYFE